jgi:hypothetical protein
VLALTGGIAQPALASACPMLSAAGAPDEPGCSHCPPSGTDVLKVPLPDCCQLHAAARRLDGVSGPGRTALPDVALPDDVVPVVVRPPWADPTHRLIRSAVAVPRGRNLPLLS